MKKIKTLNWHAWIVPSGCFGANTMDVLHVTGDVTTHPSMMAQLTKRVPQGFVSNILILEISIGFAFTPTKQPQQLHYSETLEQELQYTTVEIWFENAMVAEMNEIPLVLK